MKTYTNEPPYYHYLFEVLLKQDKNPVLVDIMSNTLWLAWCQVVESYFGKYSVDLVYVKYVGTADD